MSETKIHGFKLIKGGKTALVDAEETGNRRKEGGQTCYYPVHADLKNALQGLAIHLAILSG